MGLPGSVRALTFYPIAESKPSKLAFQSAMKSVIENVAKLWARAKRPLAAAGLTVSDRRPSPYGQKVEVLTQALFYAILTVLTPRGSAVKSYALVYSLRSNKSFSELCHCSFISLSELARNNSDTVLSSRQ